MCKVVEFIIKDEILLFMVKNNSFQHLANQIFWSMLNNLTDATEHNIEVDLVYLDFAKSFVSVPPENLICKLEKYGISGQLLSWVKDFLLNKR